MQFYKNGVAQGVEATPNAGTVFYVVGQPHTQPSEGFLHCDRADLLYLPAGSQPWGASARVSDVGCNTPAASVLDSTVWTTSAANMVVDSYRKTVTDGNTASWKSIVSDRARTLSTSKILYLEALCEIAGSWRFGVAANGAAEVAPIGNSTDSWAYGAGGSTIHNSVSTSTGVTATAAGDRIGIFVRGASIWFAVNGVLVAGDPLANTGAAYTNLTSNMRPCISTINSTGVTRIRLLSHAREQRYRPYYAEAWDGSTLLPELHYRGDLSNDPYIEQQVSFPAVWGGTSSGGGLGAIEINNTAALGSAGYYDSLIDWNLRDQAVAVDCMFDGETPPEAEARAVADFAQAVGTGVVRIISRPRLSSLETRVQFPTFLVGAVMYAKPRIVDGAALVYEVGHTQIAYITDVLDKGLSVLATSLRARSNIKDTLSFRRTVAPSGKMVATVGAQRVLSTVSLTNSDFGSWSGDNPTGWTVTETGPNALVTQSGSAARFVRTSGSATIRIQQNAALVDAATDVYFAKVDLSAWVAGTFTVGGNAVSDTITPDGISSYYGSFSFVSSPTAFFIQAQTGTTTPDFTVDAVTFYETRSMANVEHAVLYLLCDLGGFSVATVSIGAADTVAGDDPVGYYTEDRPTIARAAQDILAGHLCDLVEDGAGTIYVDRLESPDQVTSTSVNWMGSVVESDLLGSTDTIQVEDDLAPTLSNKLTYAINYDVHSDTDIAGAVSDAVRAKLTLPYSEDTCATAFHPFYAHGNNAEPIMRYASDLSASPDYTGERLGEAYSQRRRFYTFRVSTAKARRMRAGGYLSLTHSRYGLSGGKNVKIVAVRRSLITPGVTLRVWG